MIVWWLLPTLWYFSAHLSVWWHLVSAIYYLPVLNCVFINLLMISTRLIVSPVSGKKYCTWYILPFAIVKMLSEYRTVWQGSRVRSQPSPILSWRLIMKYFLRSFSSLPLNHSGRVNMLSVCKRNYVHIVLVNCLFKLAQEKVWLGELTVPPWP